MQNFKELEHLLYRNNTYKEKSKIQKEQERIEQEPMGDWQSPSDSRRWAELHKSLRYKRLRYNINLSPDKQTEKEFILNEKVKIEMLLNKNRELMNKKSEEKQTHFWFQSFFRSSKERLNSKEIMDEIQKENRYFEILINSINQQLPVYEIVIEKERIDVGI
jgi:hypothetical protein